MRNNENIIRMRQSSENSEDNKKKFIRWIALSVFLMAITILPSYEAIDFRYRKSVELSENSVDYQLKAGDVIEQKLIVDKGDRVDDLRIWLSAYAETENKGTLQITLAQGELTEKSTIDTARIVGGGYTDTYLKLTRFTDGELLLTVKVLELGDDALVFTRNTSEAIYGLPPATINGVPCGGSLSLSYKIRQPHDFEFLVSLCLVLVIIVVSIAAAYVMTYTVETPKTGWLLIGIFVLLAMATYSLEFPINTWEGESGNETYWFFYDNIKNLGIKKSLYQLEGGLYLSTLQNLIMIFGFRILHLGKNLIIFVESMSVFYLVMCLAPFCSHYFKKYFTRVFRFICSLLIVCYSPVSPDFLVIGYCGVFFLIVLLLYDFEEINNFVYAFILLVIPIVCTTKMMLVVFAPLMVIYYLLFRKEINRKKKFCVAIIGISSLMQGVLSLILRQGVQSGHKLGTIQQVSLSTLINKIVGAL